MLTSRFSSLSLLLASNLDAPSLVFLVQNLRIAHGYTVKREVKRETCRLTQSDRIPPRETLYDTFLPIFRDVSRARTLLALVMRQTPILFLSFANGVFPSPSASFLPLKFLRASRSIRRMESTSASDPNLVFTALGDVCFREVSLENECFWHLQWFWHV